MSTILKIVFTKTNNDFNVKTIQVYSRNTRDTFTGSNMKRHHTGKNYQYNDVSRVFKTCKRNEGFRWNFILLTPGVETVRQKKV